MARSKLAAEALDTNGSAAFASRPSGHGSRAPAAGPSTSLTLRPLLTPFKGRGRLFLRIEKMPQRSTLSAGKRNGDGSWSLASDELDDVTYQVPPQAAGDHVLTIRVTALDGGEATTLKVLDFPISFSAATAASVANESGGDRHESVTAGQLEQMQALFALRDAEMGLLHAQLEQEQRESRRDAERIRQQLRRDFDQKFDEAAARHQQELEAQRVALQAKIAELTARVPAQSERDRDAEIIRQHLQKDFDQRFAKAAIQHQQELETQRTALQAQIAELTAKVPEPREKERDAELVRQRLQAEFDQKFAQGMDKAAAQHQQEIATERAAFQAEIAGLTARAEASERRLQEEQQSREAYAAQWAARIEQELRAAHGRQLEAAQRGQETLSQNQLEDVRRAAAAEAETNLRLARERWNADMAIAVQQAREDWDKEKDGVIAKLQTQHERHCHDLLAAEREKIAILEAALARVASQVDGPDDNAAALQSLTDQLTAANRGLADRERDLEDAKAQLAKQLAEVQLAREQLESERMAAGQQAEKQLQQERGNWRVQENSLREELSALQSQAETQIASLTARCREAETRTNRNSWGTAIQDKARIDALNLEIGSLRSALAKQAHAASAQDRSDSALKTAYNKSIGQEEQQQQDAGRSKTTLLRDFCIAVCCITPLIVFYPQVKSFVTDFMSDDAPAAVAAAPGKPAAPQAVAKARMATVVRGVNMRRTASAKADVAFTLKKGARVEILSVSGKWTEIGTKDQNGAATRGWVYSTYLQADGTP